MNVECLDQACTEVLVPLLQPCALLEEQEREQLGNKVVLWQSSGPERCRRANSCGSSPAWSWGRGVQTTEGKHLGEST